jgi:hypothetical protein
MKITVVSDAHGKIQALSDAPQQGGRAGATLTHILAPGERLHVLDVPAGCELLPRGELLTGLHVRTHGGEVVLTTRA